MSADTSTLPNPAKLEKFQGGDGWQKTAGMLGVAGTVVAFGGLFLGDKKLGAASLLVSLAFWAGIALASTILLMIFHAFRAKWMVVLRRPLEAMATTMILFGPLLLVLFALRGHDLYLWLSHDAPGLTAHEQHLLHHKAPYLNPAFFYARTIFYWILVSFIAFRLYGFSTRQDESGDPQLTQRSRNLGVGLLPFAALAITFAAFDWLMSLDPFWFSTIFGVYYFGGSVWATLGILIVTTTLARGKDNFGGYVSIEHLHNLGKLLFAFTAFWGYIAFSQMMLIWIANLPEEIPFYMLRMQGPWAPVGVVLLFGHFVIPFFLLLSRQRKRTPSSLRFWAIWALVFQFLDIYWLVFPTLHKEGPAFHINLITSFVGFGGLAVAWAVSRVRGRYAVPVKDPFLDVSLRYRQPV